MDMLESDSEFEFYSNSSDSDDLEDSESMYDGHAENILSYLNQCIFKSDDHVAFERDFTYGDVVRSTTYPFGQMGKVVNVELVVDLESFSGEVLEKINSKKLIRIRTIAEGDYVINGSWLGKVVKVYDLVKILLDDGTKYTLSTRDSKSLAPVSPKFLEDGPYTYFPGQRVKLKMSSGYESWLCEMWFNGHHEGTVCSVEPGPVLVNWITSIIGGSHISPPRLQEAKDLSQLSCFPHVNWQLGDWCKLPSCSFLKSGMTATHEAHPGVNLQGPSKMEIMKMEMDDPGHLYSINKTKTYLDVLWQDGSLSVGLDSQSLSPVSTVGDHDFWPNQFVLEKAPTSNPKSSNGQRLGIVKDMDAKENIVNVKWVDQEPCSSNDVPRFDSEESLSAYELMEHPDFSYSLGDIVFRLRKENHSRDTDVDNCCYVSSYLLGIGNVVGQKEGYIEVKWANGIISQVKPDDIIGIDKFSMPSSTILQMEPTAEVTAPRKIPSMDEELYEMEANKNGTMNLWNSGSCFCPRTTVAFLVGIASKILGVNRSKSQFIGAVTDDRSVSAVLTPPSVETTYVFHPCKEVIVDESSQNEVVLHSDYNDNLEIIKQTNLDMGTVSMVETSQFKRFDIVNDYSDHHFVHGIGDISQVKRSWWRKVQEDWRILEKDLPDNISVRVYDGRMDLLRAAIVGAAGTPYHDALFFFDICFPPEYPHEPPVVHYISNGLRLNPNLYECGKVCLSLLKTWAGTGTEVWDPKHSTLLQVLLSLQALVLNARPYFNEAGYDKQIGRAEGERNSITYNENAFLLSRKSMLYQLRNPPKNFEALVEQHFGSRSHGILSACKSCIDGTCEYYDLGLGESANQGEKTTSAGFKIMLTKLFPMLVAAFSEQGMNCGQYEGANAMASSAQLGKEPT